MDYVGAIRAEPDPPGLSLEAWLDLIERSALLQVTAKPRRTTNPFTGKEVVLKPAPGSASLVVDGIAIASLSWSEDDSHEVSVLGDLQRAVELVNAIAAELGGRFVPIVE